MWLLVALACTSAPPTRPEPEAQARQVDTGEAGAPREGLWNRARDAKSKSAAAAEEIERLEALGYVGGSEPPTAKVGVTTNTPDAWPGVNLVLTGHAAEASLVSMDGTVLHTWRKSWNEAFPSGKRHANRHGVEFWRRAALLPDGSLLAIFEGHGLVKLDRSSAVLWTWDGRPHHDLDVLPDGRIWVLAREAKVIPRLHPSRPILEDFAVLLSPDGVELERISLLEALEASEGRVILERARKKHGDIFHTNSLAVLDGRAAAKNPAFANGNLLLSMRTPSAIAVLDPTARRMVWWHQGAYSKQHDPKILDDGSLMLFDNNSTGAASAVRVFDPATMAETWSFVGSEATPFFSKFLGTAERLPNGDTLIVESGMGRVFELTPSGAVAWEYHNPNRAGDAGQFVAIVPDLVRLPVSAVPWLDAP